MLTPQALLSHRLAQPRQRREPGAKQPTQALGAFSTGVSPGSGTGQVIVVSGGKATAFHYLPPLSSPRSISELCTGAFLTTSNAEGQPVTSHITQHSAAAIKPEKEARGSHTSGLRHC